MKDLIQRGNADRFKLHVFANICYFQYQWGGMDDGFNGNEGIRSYIHDEKIPEENWKSSELVKILTHSGTAGTSETRNKKSHEHAVRPAGTFLSED